jgi:hypothetical protein
MRLSPGDADAAFVVEGYRQNRDDQEGRNRRRPLIIERDWEET